MPADHVLIPPSLLAITPGDGRDLVPWVRALAAAGLPGLLVREPGVTAAQLARVLAASAPIGFVAVHLCTPTARACGLPLHGSAGHREAGAVSWGVSCHDGRELDGAFEAGARWATLSPVWAPTSKPHDTRAPLGLDRFLAAARGRPVLALGGVDPARFRRLEAAGAGAAVLGDLFGRPSPEAAAARLVAYGLSPGAAG